MRSSRMAKTRNEYSASSANSDEGRCDLGSNFGSGVEGGCDRDGGYGRGLSAEDAWTEGHGLPVVGGEEFHLVGGPPALGAYRQGDAGEWRFGERGGDGGGLFGFGEKDAGWAVFVFESGLEVRWVFDGWDRGATGLLGGLKGDAAPAFGSLCGGLS